MTIDPNIAIAVGVPSVLALVWLIRLEGRVNMNEAIVKGLRDDVAYIRDRIDAAMSGRPLTRHSDRDEP